MPDTGEWGTQLEAAVCENCDWSYLLPPNSPPQRCPHCFAATLTAVEDAFSELPYIHPPELVIKPQVSSEKVAQQVVKFAKGIPFHPKDLTPENLNARVRKAYLPLWLVDGTVQAEWQAEVGYDYQVVSHRERYNQNDNRWKTQEVKESRIRWEPRVGRLNRTYHNQTAAALEDEAEMQQRLGDYRLHTAEPYQPALISQSFIRLPNRPPDDAWSDAVPSFFQAAKGETHKAAEANHMRDYRWKPQFHNLNWSQLLRSYYATYYLDDAGRPQPVFINGQTGHISGSRRASMRTARRLTLIILAVAVFFFLAGAAAALAGFFWDPGLSIGGLILIFSLVIAFLALVPIFIAWNFNRKPR